MHYLRRHSACASVILAGGLLLPVQSFSSQPLTVDEFARYSELEARRFHEFTTPDLADYVHLRNRMYAGDPNRPTPDQEIAHYALKGVDTPFRLGARRFSLVEADCVTFVEQSVALALASDWESYYMLSERLRHKDGIVDVLNRNFFTLADWVPNNTAWLLQDVTDELGVEPRSFEHVVFRKRFLQNVRYGLGSEPVAIEHYEVQLGAFDTEAEALEAVDSYVERGLEAVAEQQPRGDQLLWIVMLRNPTHQAAITALNQVRRIQPSAFLSERSKAAAKAAKVAAAPEREVLIQHFVHRDDFRHWWPALEVGDILLVIRRFEREGLAPWLDCDHMLLVTGAGVDETDLYITASSHPWATSSQLLSFLRSFRLVEGFKVIRLKRNASEIALGVIEAMQDAEVPDP